MISDDNVLFTTMTTRIGNVVQRHREQLQGGTDLPANSRQQHNYSQIRSPNDQ